MDEVHAVYKALYEKGRFIGGWLPPPPNKRRPGVQPCLSLRRRFDRGAGGWPGPI